jgi:hypothetical protein
MPRTLEEVLRHADELADRFEALDPATLNFVDASALRSALIDRATAERAVLDAIRTVRAAGLPWGAIGAMLGTSGEAARQRYGHHVPTSPRADVPTSPRPDVVEEAHR